MEDVSYNDDIAIVINDSDSNPNLRQRRGKPTNSDGALVTAFDYTGAFTTAMAMLPQGILGGLLSDLFMQHTPLFVRIPVDMALAVSAGLGKERIVRFYNTESFKDLGRADEGQYWDKMFTTRPTIYDAVNQIWSIVPSGVFSYIGKVGMDGISTLLKGFQNSYTNHIATYVGNPYVQIPFMVFPFLCNLKGFPAIHNGAIELIQNALYYCVENTEFRKHVEQLSLDMEATRIQIKTLYESGEPEKIKEAQELMKNLDIHGNSDVETLRQTLLKNANIVPEVFKQNPESWKAFIAKHAAGLAAMGVTMWGFYNFLALGSAAATYWGLGYLSSYLPSIAGIMNYISLSAMGAGPYHTASNMVEHYNDHHKPVDILSLKDKTINHGLTSLACVSGVTPNVYQSLVLTGEALPTTIASGASSAFVEYGGFSALNTQRQINSKIENDETAKQFYEADQKMLEASNLKNLPKEKIHTLRQQDQPNTHNDPGDEIINFDKIPYAGDDSIVNTNNIQTKKEISLHPVLPDQYRSGYTWAKEGATSIVTSIKSCIWKENPPSIPSETSSLNQAKYSSTNNIG